MTKRNTTRWRNEEAGAGDFNAILDTFLSCDLALVEVSMGLYNVPRAEQAAIREQNRRLHGALREHLLSLEPKAAHARMGANSEGWRSAQVSRVSRKACRSASVLS
jgi:hypothetical protein